MTPQQFRDKLITDKFREYVSEDGTTRTYEDRNVADGGTRIELVDDIASVWSVRGRVAVAACSLTEAIKFIDIARGRSLDHGKLTTREFFSRYPTLH